MHFEAKPPVNSHNISQASEISDQDPPHATGQYSSSSSLEISQELASIKKEVSNIKDQVWNQVRENVLPSEEGSVQNSLTDGQLDLPYSDEIGLGNNRGLFAQNNEKNMSLYSGYRNYSGMDATFGKRPSDPSMYPSDIERHQLSDIVLGNVNSRRESGFDKEKEMLYNGVIVNKANLEGKLCGFTLVTVFNDIKNHLEENSKENNWLISHQIPGPETIRNGLLDESGVSTTTVSMLDGYENQRVRYRELVSVEKEKEIMAPANPPCSLSTTEYLDQMNNRLLEDEDGEGSELGQANPYLKKTLSVIFSTNESVQSTPTHSVSRKNIFEPVEEIASKTMSVRRCESIKEDRNEDKGSVGSSTQRSEPGSNREKTRSGIGGVGGVNELVSTLGSEENFMGLLYFTKLQNKSNKELEEKLNRIAELHTKQIEKYEKTIQGLNEKMEKFAKGNELLVRTLRTCEKEIDTLAVNNQTLHQNILMFEEDLGRRKVKEKQLLEANAVKQKENEKLREELQRKDNEFEDLKKKLIMAVSKLESSKAYAKSCEDCISAIDQTLKKILTDKSGAKMSIPLMNRVLTSISLETSKFVDKLNISQWASAGALERKKSPTPKDSGRFFTEDSSMSEDRGNIGRSAQKERPKTPENNQSPNKKSRGNVRTLSESRLTMSDKKILTQGALNKTNPKQRSLSNIGKMSLDNKKIGEKDVGLDNDERRKKLSSSNTPNRDGNSLSPNRMKTPEKSKFTSQRQTYNDFEKLKESLRKKVIRNMSPNPLKK